MMEIKCLQELTDKVESFIQVLGFYPAYFTPILKTNITPEMVRQNAKDCVLKSHELEREIERNKKGLNPKEYNNYQTFADGKINDLLGLFPDDIRDEYNNNPGKFNFLVLAFRGNIDGNREPRESDTIKYKKQLYSLLKKIQSELKKKKADNKDTVPGISDLKDIFTNNKAYKNAIEALQEVNTPVIDRNMNYLLGPREKSAFTAWFDVLKFRGKLLKTDASTMAKLLNQTIKGLNISTEGKTLRTPKNTVHKKTAYRKYYPALLKKIPS